jgi:hypothetical protein
MKTNPAAYESSPSTSPSAATAVTSVAAEATNSTSGQRTPSSPSIPPRSPSAKPSPEKSPGFDIGEHHSPTPPKPTGTEEKRPPVLSIQANPINDLDPKSINDRGRAQRQGLQDLDRDLVLVDADARVYAAAWRGDEFILGDAQGYLQAFDKTGEFRWQHFIGSSVGGIDLSPDGKTLVVTTYGGFVCILDLDTGEPDPFAISTATHRERRRWLFWAKEPTPLVW